MDSNLQIRYNGGNRLNPTAREVVAMKRIGLRGICIGLFASGAMAVMSYALIRLLSIH